MSRVRPRRNGIRLPQPGSEKQLSLFMLTVDDVDTIDDQMDLWALADLIYHQHSYQPDPADNFCDIARQLRVAGSLKSEFAELVEAMEKRLVMLIRRDLSAD